MALLLETICTAKAPTAFQKKETKSKGKPRAKQGGVKAKKASITVNNFWAFRFQDRKFFR
jgi:hypothetical protein